MQEKKNSHLFRNICIFLIILIIAGILAFRIITKVTMNSRKGNNNAFPVAVINLKRQKVDMLLNFQGLIQGDPQSKVYANVAGKFQEGLVREGEHVSQGQTLCYIDRNVIGSDFLLAPVTSPLDGIITRFYVVDRSTPITLVTPIAEVVNTKKIKVVINIGEDDLLKLKAGAPARIYLIKDEDRSVTGVVDSVSPAVDSDTLTGQVTFKAANPNNTLIVGMSAGVTVAIGSKVTYLVPDEAVIMGSDSANVYFFVNGKAKMIQVQTGYANNGMTEISSDALHENDLLITQGSFKLYDGADVELIPSPNTSASNEKVNN